MPFSDFHGNTDIVRQLREMLARDRFPHAVILAGAEGTGKYTLSLMLAQAMNCLQLQETDGLPDYCNACSNCLRIGQARELESLCSEAVEAREALRDTDKRETRIFVQTHPDVLVVPPDPPQMMIKVDQVRHVINTIHYRPAEGRRRVFIFTDAAFIKEAANALLKILEEPPDYATIFLLARNPGDLLPTIRSRSVIFRFAPLSTGEIELDLAKHRPEWNARQRELVARLSGGAVGMARSLDLAEYIESRKDALALLGVATQSGDHSILFRTTENYRAGAEGKEKTDQLLRAIYALLKDLLALNSGAPDLVRNIDIAAELKPLGRTVDFRWLTEAAQQLGQLQSGMRRNVLRSLSLDAFALSLEPQTAPPGA
jgi:DNA polymerase-3 subunit delta'